MDDPKKGGGICENDYCTHVPNFEADVRVSFPEVNTPVEVVNPGDDTDLETRTKLNGYKRNRFVGAYSAQPWFWATQTSCMVNICLSTTTTIGIQLSK